jgi:hypothetical protein
MDVRLHLAALMPGRQKSPARAATVLHIFQRIHHVRDEAKETSQTARDARPDTVAH